MSVVYCKKTRRQFLVGAGNTLLALPFLPSLFSSEAMAQQAGALHRKMMVFLIDHNVMREFWPDQSFDTTPIGNVGAREGLLRSLPSISAMNPLMTHSVYNTLRMADQFSIVRGLQVNGEGGHGFASTGGYTNLAIENGMVVAAQSASNRPTFDQYIENSPTLYPATTSPYVTKAIRVSFQQGPTYIQKIGSRTQILPAYGDDAYNPVTENRFNILTLYNEIFRGLTGGTTPPLADNTNQMKTTILNRVQEGFNSFKNNRRVSSDDIARVDQHLGFLADLQRSFASVTNPAPVTCQRPAVPVVTRTQLDFVPRYLDLLVLAFKCNLTKFASVRFEGQSPHWIPGMNIPTGYIDMHDAIHGPGATGNPAIAAVKRSVYESYNRYILDVVANRFLAPMNELEGSTGRTYLDNMVTVLMSEMGVESVNNQSSHSSFDMQQVLIGSMGGLVRSGRYTYFPDANMGNTRMPYNTFLITLLQLLGIPSSEYSPFASGGQGFGYYNSSAGNPFASRFYQPITEILTG